MSTLSTIKVMGVTRHVGMFVDDSLNNAANNYMPLCTWLEYFL